MKSLLTTFGLVLVAYFVSEIVYWRLIVPRLPDVRHVPLLWWVSVYAPFGVAAVAAGALLSSKRAIPVHACAAACIPLGVPLLWSLLSGGLGDGKLQDLTGWNPELWGIFVGAFLVMAGMFATAISGGYLAASLRARHG